MNPENLTSFEQQTLLRWFFYQLPMEQRYQLMREFPAIYNKACGGEHVIVRRTLDDMAI